MSFRILKYKTIDSTNDVAKALAEKGASEGTVVFSDFQSKGRGQFERTWQSPRGKDLLFSLVLRPEHLKANSIAILTQLAAEAVREYLNSSWKLNAKIKKPNDVLVEGKKICGILTESSIKAGKVDFVVVGIGLNVNSSGKELLDTATSIRTESGEVSDRKVILEALLGQFLGIYEKNRQFVSN